MSQPLVSVIIPTFNRAAIAREAVASAQGQTYGHLEILVVDDGSTDDSVEQLRRIAEPRLRVLVQPRNMGGADARNRGIDEAKGPLIAFLDSDDRWDPAKIEKQVAYWETERLGTGDLLYTDLVVDRGTDRREERLRALAPGERLSDFLLAGDTRQSIQTSSWLLTAADARRIRFRSGLRRHQDWDFLIRAEHAQLRPHHLREPLTVYCIDERSDHVGRLSGNLKLSADWLESVESLISREAYHTIWRWIAQSALARMRKSPVECVGIQLRCARAGALPPERVLRYLRKSLLSAAPR